MSDCLFDKKSDGVALITLNRPESMNAMGGELMPLLAQYLDECERDRSVRCVAVTGAGRAFCAGGDVKGMASRGGGGGSDGERPSIGSIVERGVAGLRSSQRSTSLRLHSMPKPTVALVNGAAAGAGLSLALAADIRFCSNQARFITAFPKVALSGDYGGSFLLQRLIGPGRAREAYFLSETIDAQKALDLGIANHVVPHNELLDRGLEYCSRLAKGPTAVYARMKANFNFGETATFAELLDHEALNMNLSSLSKDHREGAMSFVEKREPNFAGE